MTWGRFLWVTFLIDELCAQHCDADIRKALGCLPSTLTETFGRALARIISRRNTSVAAKTFSWVAIAKRHLMRDELWEAMSIEIGQPYSMPERLVNGFDRLPSWCENLIHVDEELKTVQFAHQAIYQFIVEGPTGPQFHFNLQDADHHAGEICVTYLNFNDFKKTLTRRPQPLKPVDPVAIARLALSPHLKMPSTIPGFGMGSRRHKSNAKVDVVRVLSQGGEGARRTLEQGHPFLEYASEHWISHTSRFHQGSTTWGLWHQMITCGHDLAKTPWPEQQEFNARDTDLLGWGIRSRHFGLIRLIQGCGGISAEPNNQQSLWSSATRGDADFTDLLVAFLEDDHSPLVTAATLHEASKGGHFKVVERLLATGKIGADTQDRYGRTPLSWAARNGHEAVVKLLLATGKVDVDADDRINGRTPLSWAAGNGHEAIVELLLATSRVDVDLTDHGNGRTPLSWAAKNGHLAVVKLLLATGEVDVAMKDRSNGRTPLSWATENGHAAVVELLLFPRRVGVDTKAHSSGRTPLSEAAENGYEAALKLPLRSAK